MKPYILVVDNDAEIRETLTAYLVANNFRVTAVASGNDMKEVLTETIVDLVVIDLLLQDEDGMQLVRNLREQSSIAIVIFTEKQDEADRVMGLEMAADDYLTKPFSYRELLARIRAVLRRYRISSKEAGHVPLKLKRLAYRFSGCGASWETTRKNPNTSRPSTVLAMYLTRKSRPWPDSLQM